VLELLHDANFPKRTEQKAKKMKKKIDSNTTSSKV
jgi:hypothetical protein